ncbi:MAG: hypothetical protein ACLU84_03035 [Clostridia bacterium]
MKREELLEKLKEEVKQTIETARISKSAMHVMEDFEKEIEATVKRRVRNLSENERNSLMENLQQKWNWVVNSKFNEKMVDDRNESNQEKVIEIMEEAEVEDSKEAAIKRAYIDMQFMYEKQNLGLASDLGRRLEEVGTYIRNLVVNKIPDVKEQNLFLGQMDEIIENIQFQAKEKTINMLQVQRMEEGEEPLTEEQLKQQGYPEMPYPMSMAQRVKKALDERDLEVIDSLLETYNGYLMLQEQEKEQGKNSLRDRLEVDTEELKPIEQVRREMEEQEKYQDVLPGDVII